MKKKSQQAAQKKHQQKRVILFFADIGQMIGFFFLVVVLAIFFWGGDVVKHWMDDPERVVLSQLTLSGDQRFTQENDIKQAIMGLGLPNTYMAQNVDDIRQEIMRLRWIKQASVRKQWPDRLIVHITEYQPVYFWNDVFLLDNDGVVFSVPMERIDDLRLPRLYGPENKAKFVLDIYVKLQSLSMQSAKQETSLRIDAMMVDERNSLQLIVTQCILAFCQEDQKMKLMLGRQDIDYRYQRFISTLTRIQSDLGANERIESVDLRYENGISIRKIK